MADVIRSAENPLKIRGFFSTFIDRIVLDASEVRIEYDPERLVSMSIVVHSDPCWPPRQGSNL
ncbi:MAG TPA: hypothetical protein HPP65_03030 [Gammaproteobacteria bacterium]|nr:hypothetical protein [Gammaproteobacteria bacterium]HIJ23832.1 hypothetical protein [Gammaproteobacteria bacterium]HIJ33364.1 hypothetical protein [Gammaproteobacteria bacterium]